MKKTKENEKKKREDASGLYDVINSVYSSHWFHLVPFGSFWFLSCASEWKSVGMYVCLFVCSLSSLIIVYYLHC